ncbi:hypothetical protein DFH09DRAFT_940422 [Mycena vulgaris]|nr:hypothetical protein DFH09DRAFT_940422 [Mycena vulgaris]
MDFEAAFEYAEEGGQITAKERPKAVKEWLIRARNWGMLMQLGTLGKRGQEGTFVGQWWIWWQALQPGERVFFEGRLSEPDDADWSAMMKLNGKNGFLQVMATLLWWGHTANGDDPFAQLEWLVAVEDVRWALGQMLRPGADG